MTAEELTNDRYIDFDALDNGNIWVNIENLMIEFAAFHVQEALKEAAEKAEADWQGMGKDWIVNKDSILNSYNLNNIK